MSSACTLTSGSTFPAGTTAVVCTATDASQRQAQCVFHVSVSLAARVSLTKFMAFGDSITWGEVAPPVPSSIHDYDPLNNYPTVLQALLKDRYQAQAPELTLVNRGAQGESVVVGEDRFVADMQAIQPEVVLLMEGTNDVNQGKSPSTIVGSLRADVTRAFRYGAKTVFLATLPPEVDGRYRAANPSGIEPVNDLIRAAAAPSGAILVDAYAAIAPQAQLLIGDDGLHPTIQGYKVLADTFLQAIRTSLEVTTAPATAQGSAGGQSAATPFSPARPVPFAPRHR